MIQEVGQKLTHIKDLISQDLIDQAEEVTLDWYAEDDQNPVVLTVLADIYLSKREYKEALEYLEKARTIAGELVEWSHLRAPLNDKLAFVGYLEKANDKVIGQLNSIVDVAEVNPSETSEKSRSSRFTESEFGVQTRHVLHPYFSFIFRPNDNPENSPHTPARFFSDHGFEYRRSDGKPFYPNNGSSKDKFIVAIFGGSVASNVYMDEKDHVIAGIADHPSLKGKEILFHNFAQGAFEQPQHLMVLSYFVALGQEFDFIILLDGFNEASGKRINQMNGLDVSMPQWGIIRPLRMLFETPKLGADASEYRGKILRYQALIEKFRRKAKDSIFNFFYNWMIKLLRSKVSYLARNAPSINIGGKDDILVLQNREKLDIENLRNDSGVNANAVQEIVNLWRSSSNNMAGIARKIGAQYIQCLQPNQYYCDKKLTSEEVSKFYQPDSYFAEAVRDTYPVMSTQDDYFSEKNIPFYDLTPVLDGVMETVLKDEICHFNKLGNRHLADAVIDAIRQNL